MNISDILTAPKTCCICLEELTEWPIGVHNADPVAPLGSECCVTCNDMFVAPAREAVQR